MARKDRAGRERLAIQNADLLVVAAAGEPLAIGRDRETLDVLPGADFRRHGCGGGDVPDLDRAVEAGGEEPLAIGRIGDAAHAVAMTGEAGQFFAGRDSHSLSVLSRLAVASRCRRARTPPQYTALGCVSVWSQFERQHRGELQPALGQRLILGVVDQVLRPAGQVGDRGPVDVDAQVVVQRGEHFLEVDRPVASRARPGGWSSR